MKHKLNIYLLTFFVIFFAVASDVFIIYQLEKYETRFLEVYGSQQDENVKHILQQIKRLEKSASQEDITELIRSLDASASRYWTLGKGDTMLFVKSVTETNRYKSLTYGSYYDTKTVSEFLESLGEEQTGHKVLFLGEDRFIASGVRFRWKGEPYRICLLTYDRVILEDNVLLECKNSIIIILSIVLGLLVILSMGMSGKIMRQKQEIKRQQQRVIWQNQQMEQLDHQCKRENAFCASRNVFRGAMLHEFLDALDEKNVCPLHFVVFEADTKDSRDEFLASMQEVLDHRVLRFTMDERRALLLFAKYKRKDSLRIMESLQSSKIHPLAERYCDENSVSYWSQFEKFWEEVTAL